MRYFFDTEFFERTTLTGGTIDLISIGIVSEDGRTFYKESAHFDWGLSEVDPWLVENVKPHLTGDLASLDSIKEGILSFVGDDASPEFWAYFADYDWVVFCWIFGRMIDLPKHFPMFCRDLKQLMEAEGLKRSDLPTIEGKLHNALDDARWVAKSYLKVTDV